MIDRIKSTVMHRVTTIGPFQLRGAYFVPLATYRLLTLHDLSTLDKYTGCLDDSIRPGESLQQLHSLGDKVVVSEHKISLSSTHHGGSNRDILIFYLFSYS